MGVETKIETLIAPTLTAMGFAVVRIRTMGEQQGCLQIMAERDDHKAMTVDDCASISRAVSDILDVEDPIGDAYTLEVSSPGIDRPLTRPEDFTRFAGVDAKVETARPIDGRRRFRGCLLGFVDETVRIEVEGTEYTIPYAEVARAKLVPTDQQLADLDVNQG